MISLKVFKYLHQLKKEVYGTKELNKALQNAINPKNEAKKEKTNMDRIFRIGDRIMQIKNNYDITWEKAKKGNQFENEIGSGVFNGEIGTIYEIDEKNKAIEIKFDDDKYAWYEYSELEQIEHSYSITIHKSQGSEFDVVIMCIPPASGMLLTRNLLYTGITRAKKLLIIIGSQKVIDYMIQNVDTKKRNTGLEYKLKKLYKM